MVVLSDCFRLVVCGVLLAVVLQSQPVQSQEVRWSTDLEQSLQTARTRRMPVLMEFTASWCVYCKRMEKQTFADPAVAARINSQFVPIQVDADKHKDLVKRLEIRGLPAILVVAPDLTVIDRISGFQTAEALMTRLDQLPSGRLAAPSRPVVAEPPVAPRRPAPNTPAVTVSTVPELNLFGGIPESQTPSAAAPAANVARSAPADPFQTVSSTDQRNPSGAVVSSTGLARQVAFHGVCLVTAVEDREISQGSPQYQMVYRGRLLYFQSAEHRARFEGQPEKYWPMLDGISCVTMAETGEKVAGEVQYAAVFRNRVWFFTSEQEMRTFLKEPAELVEEALEHL